MNDEPCTHDDVECLVCCDCGVAFESGEELRVARREAQRDPKELDDEEREALQKREDEQMDNGNTEWSLSR